jgi:hypothetical protein
MHIASQRGNRSSRNCNTNIYGRKAALDIFIMIGLGAIESEKKATNVVGQLSFASFVLGNLIEVLSRFYHLPWTRKKKTK